jgi:hypothetical protein
MVHQCYHQHQHISRCGHVIIVIVIVLLRWGETMSLWNWALRIRRKACPSASLSSTNSTGTDLGAKPGLRVEKPATNCLSYGTAILISYSLIKYHCINTLTQASRL